MILLRHELQKGLFPKGLINFSSPLSTTAGQNALEAHLKHLFGDRHMGEEFDSVGGALPSSDLVSYAMMKAVSIGCRVGVIDEVGIQPAIHGSIMGRARVILVTDYSGEGSALRRAGIAIQRAGGEIRAVLAVVDTGSLVHIADHFHAERIALFKLDDLKAV